MSVDRTAAEAATPQLSADGYLRLSFRRFCTLPFVARRSVLDRDLCKDLVAEDVPALHAGFCEWTDLSMPTRVSVAWAWFRAECDGPAMLAPGGISTNVMFTANGRDLGVTKSNELLRAWLSQVPWQSEVDLAHCADAGRYALN